MLIFMTTLQGKRCQPCFTVGRLCVDGFGQSYTTWSSTRVYLSPNPPLAYWLSPRPALSSRKKKKKSDTVIIQKYMGRVSFHPFTSIFSYNSHAKSLLLLFFFFFNKVFKNKVGYGPGGRKIKAGGREDGIHCLGDDKRDYYSPRGCTAIAKAHLLEKGLSCL